MYGGINVQQEPDAKGIYVNVSQGHGAEYPQAILYVRYELMEGEEPAEIPALNYSVDERSVPVIVRKSEEERHGAFLKEVILGQDEGNRVWGSIHYYSDHSLKGSVNHRIYTVEEYLSAVPEAREWVEEQLSYDNDGVRALVSKSGEGSESNYCWLIFDPSVRVGSLGATADGGNLGFDEEEDAITYSVRRNEDKNAPMALQTLTVQGLDTEEIPGLTWWEGPAGERKQVVMQAEESDIDLNYQARAAIQPWAPLESGRVTTLFSEKHEALDITAAMGTAIIATEEGTVTFAGFDDSNGNKVVIDHGNGWSSIYAHCDSIDVKEGDSVLQRQQIATVGISGSATGPHLHFELRKDDVAVDPLHYFHELTYGLYNAARQDVIWESAEIRKDGEYKIWTAEQEETIEGIESQVADFLNKISEPKNAHYFQKTVGEDAYPQLQGEGDYVRMNYRSISLYGNSGSGRLEHKDVIVFVDPANPKDSILAWQRVEDESQWDIYLVPEYGSYARQAIALIAPELESSVLSNLAQEYKTEVNSDVVGWLMIPNLGINEPVVQAEDNETYYRMDINKKNSQDGSLWVDYECDLNGGINSQNTIIYGHNNDNRQEPIRKDGSFVKFEQLMTLCYEDVAKKVPYIHFATPEGGSAWQIFAVVEAGNEWDTWFFPEIDQSVIDYAKEHSLYDYPVSASTSDKILTLSTQGPNGEDGKPGRLIVMAVQVNDAAARPSAF